MFCGQTKRKVEFVSMHTNMFTDSKMQLIRKRTPYRKLNTVGGSIMLWSSFARSGTGSLERIIGIMKSENYQRVLGQRMLPSVRKIDLSWRSWVNDPRHTSKSAVEWLKKKKWIILNIPKMSSDINRSKKLWVIVIGNVIKLAPFHLFLKI